MEVFYALLGMFMIYANVHFCVIQHDRVWEERTGYQKFLTVFTFVTVALVYLGIMFS